MSDKRFQVIDDGFSKWIIDTTLKEDRHEGTLYTAYDMCYKLNELYEENEQLKSELNDCGVYLYGMLGEMNSNPVVLKKYKELFDDE